MVNFTMLDSEKERYDKLPKWAQEMFDRMQRVLDHKNKIISQVDDTNTNSGRVAINRHGMENHNLPDNAEIKFTHNDSVMQGRDGEYKERNRFSVRTINDPQTGGQCLEIHGEQSLIVEQRSSNVFNVHSRNVIDSSMLRFDTTAEGIDE